MKRRNFLKGLFAAPLAAPAAAEQLSAGLGGAAKLTPEVGSMAYPPVPTTAGSNIHSSIEHYRKELAKVRSEPTPLSEFIRNVKAFDADIAASHSLSLSAKVRMQAERERERTAVRRESCLTILIEDLVARKSAG